MIPKVTMSIFKVVKLLQASKVTLNVLQMTSTPYRTVSNSKASRFKLLATEIKSVMMTRKKIN